MRTIKLVLFLISVGMFSTWLCGCGDEASGNCTGTIDGDIYALRIYNCTQGTMTIKVNGRAVGTVQGLDENDVCGVNDLGTFAQCSNGKVEAYSSDSVTEKLTWSEDAVSLNPDGCWIVLRIIDSYFDSSNYSMPSVDPITASECGYLETESF